MTASEERAIDNAHSLSRQAIVSEINNIVDAVESAERECLARDSVVSQGAMAMKLPSSAGIGTKAAARLHELKLALAVHDRADRLGARQRILDRRAARKALRHSVAA